MQKRGIMKNHWQLFFLLCLLPFFASGCASTVASSNALQPVEDGVVLTQFDNLEIKTMAKEGVAMHDYEVDRIINHLRTKLIEKDPNCFQEISKQCEKPSTLILTINFTRYDKGNAFARAMLAGLGQMHIDAEVVIEDKANNQVLARHEVSKTFAWGGMYGGTTRMEEIEPAFAEAIANIVLQREEGQEEKQREEG